MDDATHTELLEHAKRLDANASKLVNRFVKEGLRMDKHPAVMFKTMPLGRRAAVLAANPGLQVIDVIGTWRAEKQDVAKTAQYLHIDQEEVVAVLRYYADYRHEVDRDLEDHLDAQRNYRRVLDQRGAQARGMA